jgi:o-succinylbenzoate---CoA ligase
MAQQQPHHHICAALQQYADDPDLRDREVVVFAASRDDAAAPLPLRGRDFVAAVAGLGRALPLRPGDRCALLGETSPAYLVALLASADAGAVACPLNWRWSARELAAALAAVAPAVVLADAALLPLLELAQQSEARTAARAPPAMFVLASTASDRDSLRAAARRRTITTAALAVAVAPPPSLQLCFPPLPPSSPSSSSPDALCVFTSGTTAAPKPVRLSHTALWHQTRAKIAAVGYSREDCYLHLAPLFHVGGLSSAHAALSAGAKKHVLLPRFSACGAVEAVRAHRVTAAICVPAMLSDMLDAAAAAVDEMKEEQQLAAGAGALASLRRLLVGGGAPSAGLLERCLRELPGQCRLVGAYGMTEACSSITFADLRELRRRRLLGSEEERSAVAGAAAASVPPPPTPPTLPPGAVCAGWPALGIQVAIAEVTPSSSDAVGPLRLAAPGQVGEVLTRGPHVMSGYHVPQVDPTAAREADAAALVAVADAGAGDLPSSSAASSSSSSLWLRTGDAGFLLFPPPPPPSSSSSSSPADPHHHRRPPQTPPLPALLFLTGRLKECIRSGGENVFAPEVEAALALHPAVLAASAVGVPHARLGEAVAAAVVLERGWAWRGGADATVEREEEEEAAAAGGRKVVSAAALRAFCVAGSGGGGGAGLSRFKAPRAVVAVRELPRDPLTGKLVRAAVREAVVRALGGGVVAEGGGGGGGGGGDGGQGRPRPRL